MKKSLLLFFFLAAQMVFAQRAIPELWGHRVHDDANVIDAATIERLESILAAHEDSTGNQIAILVISSLDGDDLESYSLRVAETWKLGTEKNDNGILILAAINDRKIRIEVGQGLEGVVPDAIANQIIRKEIAPEFREGEYGRGMERAVNALIAAIGNEYVASGDSPFEPEMTWKEKLLVGTFVFFILGTFTFLGLFVPGCGGWALYAFLIPFYATFPMIILGVDGALAMLGAYIIGFPILRLIVQRTPWGKKFSKSMGTGSRGSGGGWSSGGGSSSGWSSGGGGFSGGGGSFGGGGSSGSW